MRRRILELLSPGEQTAGTITTALTEEFGISQPAISNQLRVLREAEVVTRRADGARRLYRLTPGALDEVTDWVRTYSRLWPQRLDALETEIARGRRDRAAGTTPRSPHADPDDRRPARPA